jgi:hypothetical protein
MEIPSTYKLFRDFYSPLIAGANWRSAQEGEGWAGPLARQFVFLFRFLPMFFLGF